MNTDEYFALQFSEVKGDYSKYKVYHKITSEGFFDKKIFKEGEIKIDDEIKNLMANNPYITKDKNVNNIIANGIIKTIDVDDKIKLIWFPPNWISIENNFGYCLIVPVSIEKINVIKTNFKFIGIVN